MELKRLTAGPMKIYFQEKMEPIGDNIEDVMTSNEDDDEEEPDDEDDKDDSKLSDDNENEHESNRAVRPMNQ
jgi:hypothetical protein